MVKLKERMDEAYKAHRFSEQKKLETLQKARQHKQKRVFHWMPIACTVGITLVLLILIGGQPQQIAHESLSSIPAPYHANTAIIDRVEHFYAITEDGTVTDEERRAYSKTSDWLVQRALESGESVFYNRPNVSQEQATALNELLYNMYQFIYTKQDAAVIAGHLQPYRNNDALVADTARMNELLAPFVEGRYESSMQEKPISGNAFLNEAWWIQLLIVSVFFLFCYAFYVNWQTKRRLVLGAIQLFLICLVGTFFFKADDKLYGYDETSIARSIDQHIDVFDPFAAESELLAAAEFEHARYGLAQLADGRLILASFDHIKDESILQGSITEYASTVMMHIPFGETEDKMMIVGIAEQSGITKYEVVDEKTGNAYFIDVDPSKADIYQLLIPRAVKEMSTRIYDEQGQMEP